jgi:hypothetical protein
MFQTKFVQKIKTHFMFNNSFQKSCRLWDTTGHITWSMCFACWITKATSKHTEICNTYCFSTATVITLTLLCVTSQVHCLSCLSLFSAHFPSKTTVPFWVHHAASVCLWLAYLYSFNNWLTSHETCYQCYHVTVYQNTVIFSFSLLVLTTRQILPTVRWRRSWMRYTLFNIIHLPYSKLVHKILFQQFYNYYFAAVETCIVIFLIVGNYNQFN